MGIPFRPDIEGLRAVAVVPVVIFHAFPGLLPGGYVGVDIFFVVSGFLITSLLVERLKAQTYSVRSFYQARIRRIFPALFFMLACVTPVAVWMLSPAGVADYRRTLAATALFLSNEALYRSSGYFDTASELEPLLHTWSLAVEEQYYIVFPLLLAWLFGRSRRAVVPVLVSLGAASLVLSTLWLRDDPSRAFYSALSRTFELMIGSLLAFWPPRGGLSSRAREALCALGLLSIVAALLLFDSRTAFPGVAALVPCLGAALVIGAGGDGRTWVGRLLTWAAMRWIGAMSFSLYLWHWPVLVLSRHQALGEPSPAQTLLAVTLSLALAWFSLRFVETPVRRGRWSERAIWVLAALCIGGTLASAWALRQPWATAHPTAVAALYAGASDSSPRRPDCHGDEARPIEWATSCVFGDAARPARTVVWGDSHGVELAYALGEAAGRTGTSVRQLTASACPPAAGIDIAGRPGCRAHNALALQALSASTEVHTVVLVARYELYLASQPAAFEAGLMRAVDALTAAGKRVVVIDPVPTYHYPVPDALAAWMRRHGRAEGVGMSLEDYRTRQAAALALVGRLAARPGVERFPVGERLCGTGRCATSVVGAPAYFDANHLSMAAARALVGDGQALLAP